jgi:hypothetical protein
LHASRARAARPRGSEGATTGSDHDWTLPPLVLGGIIENQNSDFVKAQGIKLYDITVFLVTRKSRTFIES